MVAWRIVLATPEYPDGREIIVIANDLTYMIGSFGIQEDRVFHKASQFARERKVPRVCIPLALYPYIYFLRKIEYVFGIVDIYIGE